jgi:hypothetical protein
MAIRPEDRQLFPARWNVQIDTSVRPRVAGVGELITRTVDVVKDRFREVATIVVASAGGAVLLQSIAKLIMPVTITPGVWSSGSVLTGAALFAIAALFMIWLQTSLTLFTGADRLGIEMSARQALKEGAEAVPAGLWTRAVQAVVLIIAFLALVVPGIILMIRFCVGMQISAFERRSGLDALRASNELVRNRAWDVFERLFVFWLVQVLALIIFGIAAAMFTFATALILKDLTLLAFAGSLVSMIGTGFGIAFYSIWRTQFYLALVDEERALAPAALPADLED